MTDEAQAPEATTPGQPQQNGVTRPKDGTKTGRVWAIADELSEQMGKPAPRADVMAAGKAEGLNQATVATQYGRWRKFHGLGREVKQATPDADDAPAVEE